MGKRFYFLSLCCMFLVACATQPATKSTTTSHPSDLTEAQRAAAVRLAESGPDFQALAAPQPAHVVDVELIRLKDPETGDESATRQVLVTHYVPATDVAVLTLVDLSAERVVSTEAIKSLAVPLSEAEFNRARQMALEDPQISRVLDGREVEVEAQLSRTSDAEDPQYGHRVVHLLFKTPSGYLDSLTVEVDLTTNIVDVVLHEEVQQP